MSCKHSLKLTGLHSSRAVFPKKWDKVKSPMSNEANILANEDNKKVNKLEHRVDIGDERSDLLGYDIYSGKLAFDKKSRSKITGEEVGSEIANLNNVEVKLTSKALLWGSYLLHLEDVVAVSYHAGVRYFTVHSYPNVKKSCCFKARRSREDFRFVASGAEEAVPWITAFSDKRCFINYLPHPMVSKMKQALDIVSNDPIFYQLLIKRKSSSKVLVILNPRSGHGRSSKVFHGKVEPIFELAGFKIEVVKTTSSGHAKTLASSVDFSTCPDGIICVGGDGLVNEVLNGLLSRDDRKEAISIPIGIIPAGSDNSLVWTVLGVRDPISAALAIVKGGLTATDVFAVEWIQTGVIHYGSTVSYFGFLSDVLELSEKYQKRFGPLRYFVAGFLKFLCLRKYSYELEYLPMTKEGLEMREKAADGCIRPDLSDFYADIVQRSNAEGLPRASSLSSIDSIATPCRKSGADHDATSSMHASCEPSEYVRGLDPKSKRLSLGRSNTTNETEEVVHREPRLSNTRIRSKLRTVRGWADVTTLNDVRSSWAAAPTNDKEDISSTVSDPGPNPGPIWDLEPKWDAEPRWDAEPTWETADSIQLPGPRDVVVELGPEKEQVPSLDERWVVKKGKFLGVLVCNHSCKTVQSFSSQVIAPKAEHDDGSLDLLLVHGSGRLKLLRFFVRLQFGRHLSLPYVEYIKVKSVKIRPGKSSNNGCGIDGELFRVNGQVMCSLLPQQCELIGRPAARDRV